MSGTAAVDPTRPLLFLDLDGVLNSQAWFDERHTLREQGLLPRQPQNKSDAHPFDPKAITRFNRILDATHPQVCFSTAWRKLYSCDELRELLMDFGVGAFDCVGRTPTLGQGPRGHEIALWLKQQGLADFELRDDEWGYAAHWLIDVKIRFCILDDNSDFYGNTVDWLVQTPWERGLQDRHVERVIRLLGAVDG